MRRLPDDRANITTVASRWKQQYFSDGTWSYCRNESAERIYHELSQLPDSATRADVAAVIGNDGWVGQCCSECGRQNAVILVGDEPDYESSTVYLCAECATQVAALATSAVAR